MDGDGFGDVLVGAPNADRERGAVYLVRGPIAPGDVGAAAVLGARLTGEDKRWGWYSPGDAAGHSVSGAGDVDGDGFDDVLVGAPYAGPGEQGAAYLLYGPVSGDRSLSLADAALRGGARERTGFAVAAAGDLDGDGFDDLVIGAPHNGTSDAGRAYVVAGPVAGDADLTVAATATLIGEAAACRSCDADRAGTAVAGAGDVDGDGLDDLLVGAPYAGRSAGVVYVIEGPVSGTPLLAVAADAQIEGPVGGFAGHAVCAAGDTDGDGYADIGFSAPGAASTVLFEGPVSGVLALAQAGATVRLGTGEIPDTCAGPGDLDGDGFDDLLVGGEDVTTLGGLVDGGAFIVAGPVSGSVDLLAAEVRFAADAHNGRAGLSLAGAGDVDGDGLPDLLVGAPQANTRDGIAYLVLAASL